MKILLLLAATFIGNAAFSQWQNKSFTHGGNLREYRVYKSPNYNASNPASMVITLHGLGDDMTNFSQIGMNYIADTANIIVVCPQAVADGLAGTAWNSGAGFMGYYPNASINDVAFISALIDTIKTNYSINPNRVYACGFSMGGFMTNRLAVALNSKITAFASVAGTFGDGLPSYQPGRPVAIAHFHGTADGTVAFDGGDYGISADSLVKFWVTNNQCNTTPIHTALPDSQNDGYTVDHYRYTGGQGNTEVEFFKVNGADHIWLTPSNDIFYTVEIWKFFNKHRSFATAGLTSEQEQPFAVYPNPATDKVTIVTQSTGAAEVTITDALGKVVYNAAMSGQKHEVSLNGLQLGQGMYTVTVNSNDGRTAQKLMIH